MTTDIEEAVVNADVRSPEQLLPDQRQCVLERVPRRHAPVPAQVGGVAWLRQCLPIDLPVAVNGNAATMKICAGTMYPGMDRRSSL